MTERREGYRTSYAGLFTDRPGRTQISSIRIPLVQRDYAQGRPGPQVEEIRTAFLDVLHDAVTGGRPVGLDFVYGDVAKDGALLPLDGQQRLTTLFLLHWFLCVRAGDVPAHHPWSRFSYDTRASARRFCERLVRHTPPPDATNVADWVVDQPWFLHGWQIDPTIDSMLTVLDAIERRFERDDVGLAWSRLSDPAQGAISFMLLPIEEIGAGDELYITMNSRGRPLTPFENFKARLEQMLAWTPEHANSLAHRIDGRWADLLWPLRGADNVVDDEFMRLLELIIELCEWREGRTDGDTSLHHRAGAVFSRDNPRVADHLSLLFDTFDQWSGHDDVVRSFGALFSTTHRPATDEVPPSVVLFGTDGRTNLFDECCKSYGQLSGKVRVFSLTQTLLLYATMLHRIHDTPDFPRRLRVLRNLLAASADEVRRDRMPDLVADVESIVCAESLDQALGAGTSFTRALVGHEQEKLVFLEAWPRLAPVIHRLEDHDLLRGALGAFELDPTHLAGRADAFTALFADPETWHALTGALLAAGDYQRRRPRSSGWQLGTGSRTNDGVWRTVLSGSREALTPTRTALTTLLDAFVRDAAPGEDFLRSFTDAWLRRREQDRHLDWRYYVVRYDAMREGATGIYFGEDGTLGYSLCMLRRTQLNSNYRDPFLLAILRASGVGDAVRDPWFTGYPENPRWMELHRSGTGLRSVAGGLRLRAPDVEEHRAVFDRWCVTRPDVTVDDDGFHVPVAQRTLADGSGVDTEDRVTKGAAVLRSLVEAGL